MSITISRKNLPNAEIFIAKLIRLLSSASRDQINQFSDDFNHLPEGNKVNPREHKAKQDLIFSLIHFIIFSKRVFWSV